MEHLISTNGEAYIHAGVLESIDAGFILLVGGAGILGKN